MGEYKIGDMVEVVEHSLYYSKGDRFVVADFLSGLVADGNGLTISKRDVRLVKETEAEKRGAKFGVTGVFKATGTKWVFACEVDCLWKGITENGFIVSGEPHQFHLDHEPEYKEIPFSEATHEQRMKKGCVNWMGHTVDEIVRFKNGTYAWSFTGNSAVMVQTDYLTVCIPA